MATTLQTPVNLPNETGVGEIPRLENGDRLTDHEFLRRYRAMPAVKKAELIEGRVYLGSPVSAVGHGEPHADIVGWLECYCAMTPGVFVGDNSTTQLDRDNVPQPDAYLRLDPSRGGQAKIGDHGYVNNAPELIVEVAATSAQYDLHEKLNVYRRNGVLEYIVWRTFDRAVDYFVLDNSEYVRKSPDADGIFRSRVFPGLWLAPAALLIRDMATVLKVLQQGIASPEHAEFVRPRA
ncbi:Uma2 family endonuclease [Humisphaera borealis]|uniref:Uma2 family endonuclease n=1 Tax=Humisphaera borealis TaxID=2807512 RepID=A0A7M2X3P8_9BACT|nr:Uma2 family endonuclease [Humisphaera borealis]